MLEGDVQHLTASHVDVFKKNVDIKFSCAWHVSRITFIRYAQCRNIAFYYYHWVDTSAGGVLVPDGITRPVVSVSITGSIPPLVDY
jgi:hypothetical protein